MAAPPPMVAAPARLGADRLASMQQVAVPTTAKLFHKAPPGGLVRVGGRFEPPAAGQPSRALMAADGGAITVMPDGNDDLSHFTGFVEVVGTKAGDSALKAVAVLPLGDQVDIDLCNEAVQMMHAPQLQSLFGPMS